MNRFIAALTIAATLASAAAAAGTAVDFDRHLNLPEILSDIKEKAGTTQDGESLGLRPSINRTERDCAIFSFSKDEPTLSERITLESREYVERCDHDPRGGRNCREEWVWTERRRVRIQIEGRGEMLPWERDIFELCLEGRRLSGHVYDASHAYKLNLRRDDDTIIAKAGHKTPSLPDSAGIYISALRNDAAAKNLVLDLKDRWASYYKGEQTKVSVTLKRHRENWFDDTLIEKELSFTAQDSYAVNFADFASEFSQDLVHGKKYYVKWRFQRLGQVSKDKWTKYWESDKTEFGSTAAAALMFDALAPRTCWYKTIEKNQCVYRCNNGGDYRQPVREPNPWDRDSSGTIHCPQLVFPF